MIVEIGHFALVLALLVALVQATLPMIGAQWRYADFMRLAAPAATVQFGLLAECECCATRATEKSEVTKAWVSARNETTK
ncbi:MAG: heme lyase NrfEFG subunit NrfE, partial [Pseudomonadota bacterium]